MDFGLSTEQTLYRCNKLKELENHKIHNMASLMLLHSTIIIIIFTMVYI